EEPVVDPGEEERDPKTAGCQLVAVAARNGFNDAVQAQAAEIVGLSSLGVVGWIKPQQLRQQGAHFGIGETPKLQTEYNQNREQGLCALVSDVAIEDELHLAGSPDVQVLPNDLFKEHPARHRAVQHLGQ